MSNWDFGNNKGKVKRLYPDPSQLYFQFGPPGKVTAMNPQDGYYFIPRTHPNYASLSSLVYLCAEHGWPLQARTQPALVGNFAEVIYLVVDF